MSLSQFEEAVGHWRGSDGGPAEAGHHGGEIVAAIEAVGEFGQVAGNVLRLKSLGWGVRRIAAEFGCSPMTVRRYVAAGGWTGYRAPLRVKALDGLDDWL